MKRAIQTHGAPAAVGPYSQAIEVGGWIFCSGQIALEVGSGKLVTGGIETETRRVMENLREVLDAAGASLRDVVKTTIFLTDLGDFEVVNRVYSEHFEQPYPARSTIQVAALPRGARVEIDAIARRPGASS
ncbi:MAG TPA: RidA family protein [Candidatus Binataceae bacterium]|jgi:2-iminobutanoate/2-iminopropanoate deaminase|nr:RidA family protein [Candidatus Binataceae bacterium]